MSPRALLSGLAIAGLLAALTPAAWSQPDEDPSEAGTDGARNVILIIGDGMDDHQITIARNYLHGAAGRLLLDQLPLRSAAQVLTIEDRVGGAPRYVADSANTATSMATGAITARGRIATSAGRDRPLQTIVEQAEAAGLRTGLVTTASVTDATPAAFATHINMRLCENPERMVNFTYRDIPLADCSQHLKSAGGMGSISEQLAASGLDVILGGGSQHFEVTAEGGWGTVLELAEENGFRVIRSRGELLQTDARGRLLGLFSPSTLPVRLRGESGREATQPEPSLLNELHHYLGDVTLPDVMNCENNPEFAGQPSLREMTEAALRHLSLDNKRGFFLMVESASIDKQSHERKPCGSIGELQQLEEALQVALAFADQHPDTLVLVTADHSQAAQLIPEESLFAAYPIPTYTPGFLARIRTPEGQVMAVNYATTNFMMEEHTGANVPLFANAQGLGRVPPFVQQPEVYRIMRDYLGF